MKLKIEEEIQKLTHNILSGWLKCPSALQGTKENDEWNIRLQLLKKRLDEQLVILFKSYIYKLVPEEMEYDEEKEPDNYDIVAGRNRCREEILKRVKEEK